MKNEEKGLREEISIMLKSLDERDLRFIRRIIWNLRRKPRKGVEK